MVQNQARFDNRCAFFCIDMQDIAYIFAVVNHQACARGLSALAGTAAAWNDWYTEVTADIHGDGNFLGVARNKHA